MQEENVYGSGLNPADWSVLRDVIWPFLHAKDPSKVKISRDLPERLRDHPVVDLIRRYRDTGQEKYLDEAGRYLIPTDKPFGWYVPLTK